MEEAYHIEILVRTAGLVRDEQSIDERNTTVTTDYRHDQQQHRREYGVTALQHATGKGAVSRPSTQTIQQGKGVGMGVSRKWPTTTRHADSLETGTERVHDVKARWM